MLHSILITGGNKEERDKKAFVLYHQINHLTMKPINNDPDFIFLKPAGASIGIAQIRDLKAKLSRKPFQSRFKIAFISEAEKLTLTSQQALLKILEEPPAQTYIILSCPTTEALLTTIQSRCQFIQLVSKNQVDFSHEELTSTAHFIFDLIKKRPGERLLLIQPYLKDRETAVDFCQQAIVALHPKLNQFAKLVKSLQVSLNLLQQNINTKLVMENMVLKW